MTRLQRSADATPSASWELVGTMTIWWLDEYADRIGWAHSSVGDAVGYAEAVGARRLVLFHHDPAHNDEELERLESEACSLATGDGQPPSLVREGMVVELT
jgi:phosphoribosyl 1,2-cyclic phosphodiesterase